MGDGRARLDVRYGAATDAGRLRTHNEDAHLASPPIFVVADGMGGHARGEDASRAVIDAFRPLASQTWATAEQVTAATQRAQLAVRRLRGGGSAQPGSTLAGVALCEQAGQPCWLVFNIGDSRTYRLRGGELEQVSVDHSQAQALIDEAGYSAARARRAAPRNVITRAIGGGLSATLTADEWLLIAATGDRLLICSDGLTTELTDHLIAATLLSAPDPTVASAALVEAAVSAGGRDNVTVIVIDAERVAGAAAVDTDDIDTLSLVPEVIDEVDTMPLAPEGPSPATAESDTRGAGARAGQGRTFT